jgi:epoxyqueuosine reductase
MGNRIYGCDDCLAICPWNKYAQVSAQSDFQPRDNLTAPQLRELAALDDADFRALFTASPIKRIGRDRFLRNVLIAIGNSQQPNLADCAVNLLDDPSPLVRGTAIWALSRLLDTTHFMTLAARYRAGEADDTVIAEWQAAAQS